MEGIALKYTDTEVTFAEVPNEIALLINISNCPCHCEGCHSSYLAEDIGELLTEDALKELIAANRGITCVSFMGGDINPSAVNDLAEIVKKTTGLKTCWYSGRDHISCKIDLDNFDFIKVGHYDQLMGPLDDNRTNQIFYAIQDGKKTNITYKFWKHG